MIISYNDSLSFELTNKVWSVQYIFCYSLNMIISLYLNMQK